jgi:membrane protein implicated in regulation of membrane protease activity
MILMLLVMFLPLIGLPVFWILPFGQALAAYLFFVALFAGTMWLMRGAMMRPRMTGPESLIGEKAVVIGESSMGYGPPYMVRVLGELWSADCKETVRPGDAVVVLAVRGNSVIVERKGELEEHPIPRS